LSLEVQNVTSGYIKGVNILENVSIKAEKSKVTTIIGPNGAGKSTLLRTIYGFLKPSKGRILFEGKDITGTDPHKMLERGVAYLFQGRSIFPELSVHENLELGCWIIRRNSKAKQAALTTIYGKYPMLYNSRKKKGKELSGGQQRILETCRSTLTKPKTILMDEPSAGVAPVIVNEVYNEIKRLKNEGFTILLVDQNVKRAVELADYVYFLKLGKNYYEAPGKEAREKLEEIVKGWL